MCPQESILHSSMPRTSGSCLELEAGRCLGWFIKPMRGFMTQSPSLSSHTPGNGPDPGWRCRRGQKTVFLAGPDRLGLPLRRVNRLLECSGWPGNVLWGAIRACTLRRLWPVSENSSESGCNMCQQGQLRGGRSWVLDCDWVLKEWAMG